MNRILTSPWMTLPVSATVYLVATVAFWQTPRIPPHQAVAETGASWEFRNPEADQLMAELKEEKKALAKRELQLNELAQRLEAERAEVNLVTQSVHQLQVEFDKNVLRVQDEESANLKKLAKVYSAMTPEGAAGIFDGLDDTSVAKIMVYMKDTETAAVLEAISKKGGNDAKRAAVLSERLRVSISRPAAK